MYIIYHFIIYSKKKQVYFTETCKELHKVCVFKGLTVIGDVSWCEAVCKGNGYTVTMHPMIFSLSTHAVEGAKWARVLVKHMFQAEGEASSGKAVRLRRSLRSFMDVHAGFLCEGWYGVVLLVCVVLRRVKSYAIVRCVLTADKHSALCGHCTCKYTFFHGCLCMRASDGV